MDWFRNQYPRSRLRIQNPIPLTLSFQHKIINLSWFQIHDTITKDNSHIAHKDRVVDVTTLTNHRHKDQTNVYVDVMNPIRLSWLESFGRCSYQLESPSWWIQQLESLRWWYYQLESLSWWYHQLESLGWWYHQLESLGWWYHQLESPSWWYYQLEVSPTQNLVIHKSPNW